MSRTVAIRSSSTTSVWSKMVLGAVFVVGLTFVAGFVSPYWSANSEAINQYLPRKGWLLMHVTTGTAAMLLGPFILGLGLGRRRMKLHRSLGFGYMVSIALSSIAAFYLAAHTDVSWVFGMGLTGLAVAWITTTGLAFVSIRKRQITQHKEWMIRSYVVTFAFVNFRILVGVLEVSGVGTLVERLNASSWFCWAFPLLVTELVLQGRKIFRTQAAE